MELYFKLGPVFCSEKCLKSRLHELLLILWAFNTPCYSQYLFIEYDLIKKEGLVCNIATHNGPSKCPCSDETVIKCL